MFSRKDVYDYDDVYDEDDQGYYEDFDTSEDPEEVIEKMRGTVVKGDCIYCGGKHTMSYEGDVCFVCSECKKSIHEDLYYLWLAGYNIDLEDNEYDEDELYDDEDDDYLDEDFEA